MIEKDESIYSEAMDFLNATLDYNHAKENGTFTKSKAEDFKFASMRYKGSKQKEKEINYMILVIIIVLSNGGSITYELDQYLYSQRAQLISNENISLDVLTLHQIDSSLVYEIVNEDDDIKVTSRQQLQLKKLENQESFEPFIVDSFLGLQQVNIIPPGIEYGHYYIQVKELEKLYPRDTTISAVIPIIADWHIFASSYVKGLEDENFVRPVKIKVEWKKSFSDYIQNHLELIYNGNK